MGKLLNFLFSKTTRRLLEKDSEDLERKGRQESLKAKPSSLKKNDLSKTLEEASWKNLKDLRKND